MPVYLNRESCSIILSVLPNVEDAANKLGQLVEQSPEGFIFMAGMWKSTSNNSTQNATFYESQPNSKIPIVVPQEIFNVTYLHIYCPNSTKLWHVRKLDDKSQHPTKLCPNIWLEGFLTQLMK